MMRAGLKPGTRPWLFAVRAYYAHDDDIVTLCELLESAWDKLEEMKGQAEDGKRTEDTSTPIGGPSIGPEFLDDDWST